MDMLLSYTEEERAMWSTAPIGRQAGLLALRPRVLWVPWASLAGAKVFCAVQLLPQLEHACSSSLSAPRLGRVELAWALYIS